MKKSLYMLGLAGALLTAAAGSGFAASDNESQRTTGAQTGSQQVSPPATGNTGTAVGHSGSTVGRYGMNGSAGTTYQSGTAAQSNPDALHPTAPPPSGGGASADSGGAGSGTGH